MNPKLKGIFSEFGIVCMEFKLYDLPSGWGFDLSLGVVGKTEPKVSGFKSLLFFRGPESLTVIMFGREAINKRGIYIREKFA